MTVTTATIALREQLARDNFPWFVAAVRKRYGYNAEQYAGSAFMNLLRDYNPVKGPFDRFARCGMHFTMLNEFSADHGRTHSYKRRAENSLSEINESHEDTREGPPDDLTDLLKTIAKVYSDEGRSGGKQRAAAVCKVLGLFDDADTAFIIGERTIKDAGLDVLQGII